jgi:acyl-CoA dehydrogenase
MFTMMNAARLGVGLQGVAVAERAYQAALAYSKERIQSSELGVKNGPRVPIIKHSDVRRMLLHMKSLIESTRAMAYYASAMEDRSHFETDPAVRKECQAQLDLFIPIVKAWCSELGVELSSTAIQIYGGMGYIEESGMPQYLRDAQIAPIYEGTNGIQSLDLIGRKVAMERGATVQKLGLQMQQTVSELAEHENNDDCVAMQKALERGMKAVADSTMWVLLAFGGGNMALASANSMPYLRLMGIMGGGWLMAKSMLIALDKLDKIKKGEIQGNVAFYEAKLVTGRYYADYIMSRASGLAHAITHGGYSVLALKDEQF